MGGGDSTDIVEEEAHPVWATRTALGLLGFSILIVGVGVYKLVQWL